MLGLAVGKRLACGGQRLFELKGAHLQLGLLLLLLSDFRGHGCQLRSQRLLAVELMALGGQALQANEGQAGFGQLLPALFGGL
ncbi:hypothetical protein D3C81_1945280 [compost metagenome]